MHDDTTNAPAADAVGSPLDRMVRPVATVHQYGATVRLDWHSVEAAHNARPGPLYDQAALDSAAATERERCIEAVEGNFAGSSYGLPPRIAALIVERIRGPNVGVKRQTTVPRGMSA